jgi:hypothetical protein
MQRSVRIDSFGGAGRVVTVSPRLFIVLDASPIPPVALPLSTVCGSCGAVLVSWALPVAGATVVSCTCSQAVCRPNWTAEELAEHWKGVVQIRGQAERQSAPPSRN